MQSFCTLFIFNCVIWSNETNDQCLSRSSWILITLITSTRPPHPHLFLFTPFPLRECGEMRLLTSHHVMSCQVTTFSFYCTAADWHPSCWLPVSCKSDSLSCLGNEDVDLTGFETRKSTFFTSSHWPSPTLILKKKNFFFNKMLKSLWMQIYLRSKFTLFSVLSFRIRISLFVPKTGTLLCNIAINYKNNN